MNENTLNFSKTFNEIHTTNIVVGYTYQNNMSRSHSIAVSGLSNNITKNYDLAAAETIGIPNSGMSKWVLASYLGRANYTLNNKYLFTASIRFDGSSRFGANNKWGYFPSGAFAWRLSEETFMQELTYINDLKFRLSYGITGNTALSPYQSLDRMSTVNNIFGNHMQVIGFVPSGIANNDLKWETTAQYDIGLDLNLFDNKVRFTFDYYKKNTTNLLASVPLPPSIGFGSILQNIGEIQNQGFEFSGQVDVFNRKFKGDIMIQISTNQNKVIELAGGSDIYGGSIGLPFGTNLNLATIGKPFGVFWGYLEDGLNEKGYIKYKDINNDGIKNNEDKVILGSPYPDFIYGFNANCSYKNFDLSLFFEGVYGNEIIWATSGTHLNSFQRGQNQFSDIWGKYWTEENPDPNAKYPIISRSVQPDFSDRFVKDGSYIRLKSLRFAYNLPMKKMGLTLFDGAQIYFSGNNLLTITNYPGLDPEVNTRGSDDSSVSSRLRLGIDEGAYPAAKIYAVGLKFKF